MFFPIECMFVGEIELFPSVFRFGGNLISQCRIAGEKRFIFHRQFHLFSCRQVKQLGNLLP